MDNNDLYLIHCYITMQQYDDDPDCFRRIISYLQLKELLGDMAPEYVSHVLQVEYGTTLIEICDIHTVI